MTPNDDDEDLDFVLMANDGGDDDDAGDDGDDDQDDDADQDEEEDTDENDEDDGEEEGEGEGEGEEEEVSGQGDESEEGEEDEQGADAQDAGDQPEDEIDPDDIAGVDDDVYSNSEDFANAAEEDFEHDEGDWTAEDYDESSERLFGDNEFFGEDIVERLTAEGYTEIDDSSVADAFTSVLPTAEQTVNFFQKDDRISPVGFVIGSVFEELLRLYPDADFSRLHFSVPYKEDPEQRDTPIPPLPAAFDIEPAAAVDLRKYCSPVGDQGQTSRCAAFAWTHAAELVNNILGVETAPLSCTYSMLEFQKMQGDYRDDIYAFKGGDGTISGPRPGEVLIEQGTCHKRYWPDDQRHPAADVNVLAGDAPRHRLQAQVVEVLLEDVKKVLTAGCPVQVSMDTGPNFSNLGRDGVFDAAEEPSGEHGRHAMLIVGYIGNHYIVKNSWGTDWGDKGYCYIPHKVLADSEPEFVAIAPVKPEAAAKS